MVGRVVCAVRTAVDPFRDEAAAVQLQAIAECAVFVRLRPSFVVEILNAFIETRKWAFGKPIELIDGRRLVELARA